jgi:hypothetical protein
MPLFLSPLGVYGLVQGSNHQVGLEITGTTWEFTTMAYFTYHVEKHLNVG